MKRFAYAAVALLAVVYRARCSLPRTRPWSGRSTTLKLESVPQQDPKIMGAPPRYKVTKATIEYLQKLEKEGKIIEVQGNGGAKIK